jgi:transketolase
MVSSTRTEGAMMSDANFREIGPLAAAIRRHALNMVHRANASHIGSCLSVADLLAVLYGCVLRVDPKCPKWPGRDRFILSKGHAAAALYAVLAECGFFPIQWLDTYCQEGSALIGHVSHHVPGVEASTGSLGHGLPISCGIALAGNRGDSSYRVFVLLGDGECDEGSNWEAALFAAHHQLENLVAIIDYNKLQGFGATKDVLNLDPLADKWKAFNWAVREIDGHDLNEVHDAMTKTPIERGRPTVIIAHTVKGKGVAFMENQLAWHYKSPSVEQLRQALGDRANL